MSSNDIYTLYNIDLSRLKRDYILYPLKRGKNQFDTEHFIKEDLYYMFIELNLRIKDLMSIFNMKEKSIRRELLYHNIKKSSKLFNLNTQKCFIKKYGVNTASQVPQFLDKQINKCILKYNSRSSLWGSNRKNLSSRSSNKSSKEIKWLNDIGIPCDNAHRQVLILTYHVDGFDPNTNTVYEFLGDFWHGNLNHYNPSDINPCNKCSYKQLYDQTFIRLNNIKNAGYNVIYIWESEYNKKLPYNIL